MQWFWMNVPLAAIFIAVWAGVPLWQVLKHPDTGPEPQVPDLPDSQSRLSSGRISGHAFS